MISGPSNHTSASWEFSRGNLPRLSANHWIYRWITGWWFGTWILFFNSVGNSNSNWLIFFRGVGSTTNQIPSGNLLHSYWIAGPFSSLIYLLIAWWFLATNQIISDHPIPALFYFHIRIKGRWCDPKISSSLRSPPMVWNFERFSMDFHHGLPVSSSSPSALYPLVMSK